MLYSVSVAPPFLLLLFLLLLFLLLLLLSQALASCRYDRKALPGLRTRFNTAVVNRLNGLLMRGTWKHTEEPVTLLHRNRLESMIVVSEGSGERGE